MQMTGFVFVGLGGADPVSEDRCVRWIYDLFHLFPGGLAASGEG